MGPRLRSALFATALLALRPAVAADTPSVSPAFDKAVAASRAAMMASPSDALQAARRAEHIAGTLPPAPATLLAQATAQWLEGEASARLNAPRQALPILERALATVERVDPRDRLRGDLLLSRGWVQGALGNIPKALHDYQQAHAIFHALGERRGQAKALQNIAGIYHDAGDDQRSLRYSAQVAELADKDPPIALAAFNNVGEALKAMGRYRAAERQYRSALAAARKLDSPLLEVRVLTNLASAQVLDRDLGAATITVRRALTLSEHGEAAGDRPFVWGMLGEIAAARGDYESAGNLLDRTFEGVDLNTSTLPYREFHQQAADIYRHLGRYDLAFQHLAAFKRLDDGARALAASTNAALMAARFDFTGQNLRIARLKTDQVQDRARLHTIVFSIALAATGTILVLLTWSALSLRRSRNRVRAANAALTDSNRSLEQALKVKTDFLATTSHEIRTPLNGILGMTQVILADPTTDVRMRERIGVVHGAGETMKALVDDILDISKIETGNLSVCNVPLDLHRLLREANCFWQGQAAAKRLELAFEMDGVPRLIVGDDARLRQIIFNLMSNALKFTQAGTVTLRAWVDGAHDQQLCIAVRDSGIGIPEQQLERIFEKFHQVDSSTARRFGGTGLGLAICRSLADVMEGSLGVESREGEGSTFTLRLPLRVSQPEPVASAAALPANPFGALADRAVLLVDANPLTQRVLAKALRGHVREVDTCAALADVDAKLAEQPFGLLVVQAEIAGAEDAAAALEAIVRSAGQAHVAILHGAMPDETCEHLSTLGATLIAKPVSGSALVAALQYATAAPDVEVAPQRLAPAA